MLENLKPEKLFHFFEVVSSIPRSSGNEKAISDYLVCFAKERNLEVIQDEYFNVIIKKPAKQSTKKSKTIILQGHLDMVCEKNENVVHDFLKEPLDIYIDGDYIKANGTTLGADNGNAIAIMMTILDDDFIKHPNLECVFTTNEETGLTGATNLDASCLTGKYLINIDTEKEGDFYASCAGGCRVDIKKDIDRVLKKQKDIYVSIFLKGFFGGHSGADIHLGRGNSIVSLSRLLFILKDKFEINLVSIDGGSKDNAIPREAKAIICIDESLFVAVQNECIKFEKTLIKEFAKIENNISIETTKINNNNNIISNTNLIIDVLNILPNGIHSMSHVIDDLVETSNNIGVISTTQNKITITSSLRSSVKSKKIMLIDKFKAISNLIGADMSIRGDYPGWDFAPKSHLRNLFIKTYENKTGKKANIVAIHAGLECGIFTDKINDLDVISLGPTGYNAHTPDECVSISSLRATYELIVEVLREF